MELFTSTHLKGVYNQNFRSLNEEFRTKIFSSLSTFDIFLSHNFLDREEVLGVYYELTKRGFSVYVDWIVDPHLDRANVTKASATVIRNRMKASNTLLLAISHNASVSKWMPWELGFVDGKTGFCAIVPVSTDNINRTSFAGAEYLSLYPFISHRNNRIGEEQLWVENSDGAYVTINDWVRNKTQPFNQ